jgi:hypothetical protein
MTYKAAGDWIGVVPEHIHTPVGRAHYTSGAPDCSEIPHSLAWGRKVPSGHGVPRGGTVRVLTCSTIQPPGRGLQVALLFAPGS